MRHLSVPIVLCLLAGCASPPPEPAPMTPAARREPAPVPDSAPATSGSTDPRLDAFAREVKIQRGEARMLAVSYVRSARARLEELRYAEASNDLERAVQLDPTNDEARRLLDRVRMADPCGPRDFRGIMAAMAAENAAKIEQDRLEVARLFSEAQVLMEKRQYDHAIRRFERILEAFRWSPYDLEEPSLEIRARAALAKARAAKRPD